MVVCEGLPGGCWAALRFFKNGETFLMWWAQPPWLSGEGQGGPADANNFLPALLTHSMLCSEARIVPMLLCLQVPSEEGGRATDTGCTKSDSDIPSQV